jgi:transglutaminase-like putative cysteine protease
MSPPDLARELAVTYFIDHDAPAVEQFASAAAGDESDPLAVAERLFYAVRDGIRYDPYRVSRDPVSFRASSVAVSGANWCVPKSVLLAACARARGIPARLGFADVKNHLSSDRLSASMGTNLFAWHGYAELWLESRWVKLSTAFNIELCQRFGVRPLEFDGVNGALMHPFDNAGNRHMEYVRERGSFADLPLDAILKTFDEVYPGMETIDSPTATRSHDAAFHG